MLKELLTIIVEMLEKIPVTVFILILNIWIGASTYRKYVITVKGRNRILQLTSHITDFLRDTILFILVFPLINIYCVAIINSIIKQGLIKDEKVSVKLIMVLIMLMIISIVVYGCIYIYKLKKDSGKKTSSKKEKLREFKNIYMIPIAIIIGSIFLCLLLIGISMYIIDVIEKGEDLFVPILMYIAMWALWIILILRPYDNKMKKLQRNTKEVKIFYNQNGELKIAFGIEYNDFDVNKDFVTFYSKDEKCRSVIPAKDLVKIQYFYNE